MNKIINVLDKGFVELVDYMGNDLRICQAARVSTGAQADKGDKKNKGLINYLYRNEHLTPFEQVTLTFHVKCPIFVARQWFRHRTMSFNEASGRYKEFVWEPFKPDKWRLQDTTNHQSSSDNMSEFQGETLNRLLDIHMNSAEEVYKNFLDSNTAREQARTVMPLGQYTEFFMTVDLRNLFHFLELRMNEHAQYEIRQYAFVIHDILRELDDLKWSVEIFEEMYILKEKLKKKINKYKNNLNELSEKIEEL